MQFFAQFSLLLCSLSYLHSLPSKFWVSFPSTHRGRVHTEVPRGELYHGCRGDLLSAKDELPSSVVTLTKLTCNTFDEVFDQEKRNCESKVLLENTT